jgi:hypothetical protein
MIPVLQDNALERQGGLYRQQQPVERRASADWDGWSAGSALDTATLA